MKKIFVLCLTIILLASAAGCADTSYLEANHSILDIASPDLSLMELDLDNAQVILGGEYHAVKANYDARFCLLTTLHQQEGFNYLLCEMGHGVAGLLNIYLETGDPAIPDRILKELKGSASWSQEFSEFWQRLYEYNQQQSEDKKVIVIGVDIEWQVGLALDYLATLEGLDQLPLLENADSIQSADFPDFVHSILQDLEDNPDLYSWALGENLFDFEMVMSNLATLVAYYEGGDQGMHIREQAMYQNFLKLYSHYPHGKYFGQLGMAHVYQEQCGDGMEGVERFAMALNREDSPVKGRVISIAYEYINSKMLSWQNNYKEIAVEKMFPDTRSMQKLARADFTLFRLNGEDSPYALQPHMIPGSYGGVTTDYFQYILAIRDSPAITAYGPIE